MRKLFFAHFVLSIGQNTPLFAMERIGGDPNYENLSRSHTHEVQKHQEDSEGESLPVCWTLEEGKDSSISWVWVGSSEQVEDYTRYQKKAHQLDKKAKEQVKKVWKEAESSFQQLLQEEQSRLSDIVTEEGDLAAFAWERMKNIEKKGATIKKELAKALGLKNVEEASAKEVFSTLPELIPYEVLASLRTILPKIILLDRPNTTQGALEMLLSEGGAGTLPPCADSQDLSWIIMAATTRLHDDPRKTEKSQEAGQLVVNAIKSILAKIYELKSKHQNALKEAENDQAKAKINQEFEEAFALKHYGMLFNLQAPMGNVKRQMKNVLGAWGAHCRKNPWGTTLEDIEMTLYYLRNLLNKTVKLLCENHPVTRELLLCLSHLPQGPRPAQGAKRALEQG